MVAAKTFLDVYPTATVNILEAASSLGGVWAQDRLYRGLKSNNMAGTYEYSDFPMLEAMFGVRNGQHIPGEVVNKYLEAYAQKFNIKSRIRFSAKADTIEKESTGHWRVSASSKTITNGFEISARKLILATGLATEAVIPVIPGQSSFGKPFLHCKDLGKHHQLYVTSKSVAILGGSKSAWDAAYTFARLGTKVHWIMGTSGHGPACMAPPIVKPFNLWLEKIACTRFCAWLSPCIWGGRDGFQWIRHFWERTTIGKWVADRLWRFFERYTVPARIYNETLDIQKLKPWGQKLSRFGGGFSVLNYPTDFFQYVRNGRITVHEADIDHLSPGIIHLQGGRSVLADSLIYSSGWKHLPDIRFLPEGLGARMGLPDQVPLGDLEAKADDYILQQFPLFEEGKSSKGLKAEDKNGDASETWRLYRFMVPPELVGDKNIGVVGAISSLMHPVCAQAQALWLVAYFNGNLLAQPATSGGIPSGRVWEDTMIHSQFPRWRYPGGHGDRYPVLFFDGIPYVDLLLDDLGLPVRRKSNIFAEIFQPYGPSDYRNLVEEWKDMKTSIHMMANESPARKG